MQGRVLHSRILYIFAATVFFVTGLYFIIFPASEPFGAAPGKEALGLLAEYLNSLFPGGEGLFYVLASIVFTLKAMSIREK